MSDFVLVHGAGTGGWLWDDVADRLRRRGHTPHAPSLVGVGDRSAEGGPDTDVSTHVAQVVEVIERAGIEKATLVGFTRSRSTSPTTRRTATSLARPGAVDRAALGLDGV